MSKKCSKCDDYKKQGHNYCRMCGVHIRKGYARNARVALAYFTQEKYCGYCGEERHGCDCR